MRQVSWVCSVLSYCFCLISSIHNKLFAFWLNTTLFELKQSKRSSFRCLQCNGHVSVEHFIKFSSWISSFKIFPIKWHVEEERQAQPVTSYGLQDRKKWQNVRTNIGMREQNKSQSWQSAWHLQQVISWIHFTLLCILAWVAHKTCTEFRTLTKNICTLNKKCVV